MTELPDDELDKLFRKSEELDPEYDPTDWNALKKRLDREDGRTPAGWLRKWWPLGLLALLIPAGLVGYWFYNSDSQTVSLAQNSKPETIQSESKGSKEVVDEKSVPNLNGKEKLVLAENKETAESTESEIKKPDASEISTSEIKERKSVTKNNDPKSDSKVFAKTETERLRSSKILPRSRSKAGGVYLEPNRSKGKEGDGAFSSNIKRDVKPGKKGTETNLSVGNQRGSEQLRTRTANRNENPDRQVSQANMNAAENENVAMVDDSLNTDVAENRLALSVALLDHLPFIQTGIFKLPAIAQPETPEMPEIGKERDLSPKMAIRVGYSPDLSTVGLKNFSKPGSAFSVLIEYGLWKKLYIQAGLSRSEKIYKANASEYMLKKYVTDINTPYEVDGTCNMFEIPLGVRYDISQKANSRFFAGTGITSYYVQKEKYTYHYSKYVHGQKPSWQGKTGLFLLSHVNASIGYERRITNKLSILAEPYVRIPIKGVGYGEVKLVTTGMWLSLRYTPVFFK